MTVSAVANTEAVLASSVNTAGTFTVPYPAGFVQADLTGSTGGVMSLESGETFKQAASGDGTIGLSFEASTITVTQRTGITLPAGTRVFLSFGEVDIKGSYNLTNPKAVQDFVNDYEPPSGG